MSDELQELQERTRQRQRAALAELKASGKSLLSRPVRRRADAGPLPGPAYAALSPPQWANLSTACPACQARQQQAQLALQRRSLLAHPQPASLRAIAGFRK